MQADHTEIGKQIARLVSYGLEKGLISEDDKIYATNLLLDLMEEDEYTESDIQEEAVGRRIV